MVAINISKAFDTIDHVLLLDKIADSSLDSNVVRWLAAYLRSRTAVCLFQGATSKKFKCHDGVSHGSVLSPHISNYFVSDFPAPAEENGSFADNFHLTESSPN
jgi:retron-type reverse transcriptase